MPLKDPSTPHERAEVREFLMWLKGEQPGLAPGSLKQYQALYPLYRRYFLGQGRCCVAPQHLSVACRYRDADAVRAYVTTEPDGKGAKQMHQYRVRAMDGSVWCMTCDKDVTSEAETCAGCGVPTHFKEGRPRVSGGWLCPRCASK